MVYMLVVAVATVLGAVLYLPQLLKLLRTGSVDGLSPASLVNGSVSFLAWSVYLAFDGEWLLFWANTAPAVVWLLVTGLALPRLRPRPAAFASTLVWLVALVGASTAGMLALGSLLAVSVLWSYLPAAVHAWRTPALHGVAVSAWVLSALEGSTWFAAGMMRDLLPVMSYGAAATLLSTAVVLGWMARPYAREPQPEGA